MTLWKKRNSGKVTQAQVKFDLDTESKLQMLKWMISSTPQEQAENITMMKLIISVYNGPAKFTASQRIAQLLSEFKNDCGWTNEQLVDWLCGRDTNGERGSK